MVVQTSTATASRSRPIAGADLFQILLEDRILAVYRARQLKPGRRSSSGYRLLVEPHGVPHTIF